MSHISIRLSDEERRFLQDLSKKYGVTYKQLLLIGAKILEEFPEIVKQISSLKDMINNFALELSKTFKSFSKDVSFMVDETRKISEELYKIIYSEEYKIFKSLVDDYKSLLILMSMLISNSVCTSIQTNIECAISHIDEVIGNSNLTYEQKAKLARAINLLRNVTKELEAWRKLKAKVMKIKDKYGYNCI